MKKSFYLILFAIAMVVTIYYNGFNVQIAKNVSVAIYAFLFVIALTKSNSSANNPTVFKSWLFWLVLACFVNLFMSKGRLNFEQIVNLEIAMPLMVAFSSYSLFDIKRENLPYYMFPICAISAFFAVSSVLSGIGGFIVDEYYEADVAKNQVGIAYTLMAIISLVFMLELKRPVLRIGYAVLSVFSLVPAVFFACRTALLSYFIVAAFLIFREYKFKGLVLLGLVVGAYLLIDSGSLETLMYESIVGRRDVNDFDNLTSGRVSHATKSLDYLFSHPLLGFYGSDDSFSQMPPKAHIFILYRLTWWGILGSIPFIALYWSVFKILVNSIRQRNILIAGVLFLAFVSSFSEYSPPFGPGSSHIIIYILIGYYLRTETKKL